MMLLVEVVNENYHYYNVTPHYNKALGLDELHMYGFTTGDVPIKYNYQEASLEALKPLWRRAQ